MNNDIRLFSSMTPEEQTAHLQRINAYVHDVLPGLVAAGRAISGQRLEQFHEGLRLLQAFPQYAIFAVRTLELRHDYHMHIATMQHQFRLLSQQLSDAYTVRTHDGQHVVVVQQTQTLRRGRPTQAESEQRRRDEEAAARATAVAALTGATISTTDAAPLQERESDTSRRKKDEPDLFDAAIKEELGASLSEELGVRSEELTPSDQTPAAANTPHSSLLTPNSESSSLLTPNLRFFLPLMSDDLASRVRTIRDLRADMAHESEAAKLLFEQGADPVEMQPHTELAKDLNRQIMAIYADVDEHLAYLYLMLTEVNAEWQNLPAKWMKQTGEPLEKLCAHLKPYATRMAEQRADWLDTTLSRCRRDEEQRRARETRDPEKEREYHKMDAYIRRKDVNPSPKRLDTMRQYRARLEELGADADSLAAYDVFIEAVARAVEAQEAENAQ